MRFIVIESTYNNQGTAKAFSVSDQYNRTYWIPRSQVKIVERTEPRTKFDSVHLTIEVPDWIIRKNGIPVFNVTEMVLDR